MMIDDLFAITAGLLALAIVLAGYFYPDAVSSIATDLANVF